MNNLPKDPNGIFNWDLDHDLNESFLQQLDNKGIKHDQGKPPIDLVPKELIEEVSKVLGFGATKYARFNWLNGMDWSRVYAAAMRHLLAWNSGEDIDPESNLPHLAHAGCCIAFLLTYQERNLGTDDRYKPNDTSN